MQTAAERRLLRTRQLRGFLVLCALQVLRAWECPLAVRTRRVILRMHRRAEQGRRCALSAAAQLGKVRCLAQLLVVLPSVTAVALVGWHQAVPLMLPTGRLVWVPLCLQLQAMPWEGCTQHERGCQELLSAQAMPSLLQLIGVSTSAIALAVLFYLASHAGHRNERPVLLLPTVQRVHLRVRLRSSSPGRQLPQQLAEQSEPRASPAQASLRAAPPRPRRRIRIRSKSSEMHLRSLAVAVSGI